MITDSVWQEFTRLQPELRTIISGWTRDQNDLGEAPTITSYALDRLRTLPVKSVAERIDRLLRSGITAQQTLGGTFVVSSPEIIARTYSRNVNDVDALAKYLVDENFLVLPDRTRAQVTARGFVKGQTTTSAATSAFIAMWFTESMSSARTAMQTAIQSAGYDPVLVDAVEHVHRIDDEIIAQIRKSRFLVAEFTGQRGGVYFEAGFAMGLGLPVFWVCRKDDMANLHFDIRQYNCIDWETDQDLEARLQKRIEAVLGRGPRSRS
jgi:nucleoside 2-deoxyribosyltransferase